MFNCKWRHLQLTIKKQNCGLSKYKINKISMKCTKSNNYNWKHVLTFFSSIIKNYSFSQL